MSDDDQRGGPRAFDPSGTSNSSDAAHAPDAPDAPDESIGRFGPYEVDRACYELRRNGERIPIQGRPLSLLIYLMDRRHRVVSKEEIHEHVWAGVIVCESTMASAIRDLRRALDDTGREQRVIRTVHGVGYRFVAPLSPPPPLSPPLSPPPALRVSADRPAGNGARRRPEGAASLGAAARKAGPLERGSIDERHSEARALEGERRRVQLGQTDGASAPRPAPTRESWAEGFQHRLLAFLARELAAAPADVRLRDLPLGGLGRGPELEPRLEANGTEARN